MGAHTSQKISGKEAITAVVFVAVLGAAFLPTIVYPYLLTDELWVIRLDTPYWALGFGRPMFGAISWIAGKLFLWEGLEAIYWMRASAIVALALSAILLARWLEKWGTASISARLLALATMTLPAFQIIVADGTPLAFGVLMAMIAPFLALAGFQATGLARVRCYLGSAVLVQGALIVYQQTALMAFAVLIVPVLSSGSSRFRFAWAQGLIIAIATLVYFIVWRTAYRIVAPDRMDTRYGPDAVQIPSLEHLVTTLELRFIQVAELWSVDLPALSVISGGAAALIMLKLVTEICADIRRGLMTTLFVVGLFVAADGIALAAGAYPSYVTAPAISLIVLYAAFAGASVVMREYAFLIPCILVIVGVVSAHITLREIAIPNWRHMVQIREAILANPEALNFHVLGDKNNSSFYQEFSWMNARTDVYLHMAAVHVAEDLARAGAIPKDRFTRLHFSVGRVLVFSEPAGEHANQRPGSVTVELD